MQELRDDLVATLKMGDEALNEIQDISIRESCQKVVQLTLESIIKRIDEELLEMEKEQIMRTARQCYFEGVRKRAKTTEELIEYAEQYYNETFKQQEQ
jgi:NCAIR mutase (PurE)-related protein